MTAKNSTPPKDALIELLDTLVGEDPHSPVVVRREGKEDLIVVSEATYDRIMAQAILYRDMVEQPGAPEVSQAELLKTLSAAKAPEDED